MNIHARVGTSLIRMNQGSKNFSMIPWSWSRAWFDKRMTDASMKIIHFLSQKPPGFRMTQRMISDSLCISLETTNKALLNLHALGVAIKQVAGEKTLGYEINTNIEIPELDGRDAVKYRLDKGSDVTDFGTSCSKSCNTDVTDSGTHIVNGTPKRAFSSLRSEKAGQKAAKPAATIRTEATGQIGIQFSDDQAIIPNADIDRIIADIRKLITADPEDYELREHVNARIAFMTSAEFRGRRLERGGKEMRQANISRIISFCMRVINRPDFRWNTKRADQASRFRVEKIREEITELERRSSMCIMRDGSTKTIDEYRDIVFHLNERKGQLIRDRLSRRPKKYTPAEWRSKLEESLTLEEVAKMEYGQSASAYISAGDRARIDARVRIAELRQELYGTGAR